MLGGLGPRRAGPCKLSEAAAPLLLSDIDTRESAAGQRRQIYVAAGRPAAGPRARHIIYIQMHEFTTCPSCVAYMFHARLPGVLACLTAMSSYRYTCIRRGGSPPTVFSVIISLFTGIQIHYPAISVRARAPAARAAAC
jgi:hypothetical protein